jgi:hypothetical protein
MNPADFLVLARELSSGNEAAPIIGYPTTSQRKTRKPAFNTPSKYLNFAYN